MTAGHWERVKTLFERASECRPEERSAWLLDACAGDDPLRDEVARLLAADEAAAGFLEVPTYGKSLADLLSSLDEEPVAVGQSLGSYRIVRELGSGGMGTVYLAERDDDAYRKRAAVKVVRAAPLSSKAVQRFRDERQILAELDHPNIARLIDGGTSATGLPFLVMEYVDGAPIDVYCDERRLPIAARLALFADVCAAVQHAHQHLVVHRDIKASNVLVTAEGQAKLLDFGIAKLLAEDGDAARRTMTHDRLLTPESASPEQVRGDHLTTASDVYQLGVLLYGLLTGSSPYRSSNGSPQELARAICEEEPARPSSVAALGDGAGETSEMRGVSRDQLRRLLAGDLDVIVEKALRKAPERRYVTVAALADDVRRHLAGLPVTARAESVWYRVGKLAARHRLAVAAVVLVFLSLIGGLAATTWQARVARAERARAARRFDEVRQLAHDFVFDVHEAIRELPGSTPARALVVRKGLAYLDRLEAEAGGDPTLVRELASAYEKLGDIQGGFRAAKLGDTGGALGSYRRALSMRETLLATASAADEPALRGEVATSHAKLGALLFSRGETAAGRLHLTQAIAALEALRRAGRADRQLVPVLASAYTDLGYIVEASGDPASALATYRRAEALYAEARLADPGNQRAALGRVRVWSRMGRALAEIPGRGGEALDREKEALAVVEELAAARPASAELAWSSMTQHMVLGVVAHRLGETALARSSYDRAIATGERLLAADPENAQWRHDLALSYMLAGNLAAHGEPASAVTSLERALALDEPLVAKDPADLGVASVVALSQAGLGAAHAALARSSAPAERFAECHAARGWLERGARPLRRFEELHVESGWERWLARQASAAVAGCETPTTPRP